MKKILSIITAIIFAGLLLFAGYGYYKTSKQNEVLTLKIAGLEKKVKVLKKKYKKKNIQTTQLLRLKSVFEAKNRELQAGVEKLKKENTALLSEKKNFEKKVEKQTCLLNARIRELSEKYADASARLDDAEKKYKVAEKKFNQDLKVLTTERDDISSKLKRSGFMLTRCREDNAGLCGIAEELVKKYKNKGILNSIIEKEPVTQIKKVQLEKFTAEYIDTINQHKINN
ncbi:MAG: hypothetical protein JJV92_07310 [Desulfosarcina sp.]|nr:hypothetical protein [Desulfobacterales bacterium]